MSGMFLANELIANASRLPECAGAEGKAAASGQRS